MAGRHELTAAEWARMAPLLPARETRGTYYADHRRVLNDMLYGHATGCAWRDLPERYGPWSTVASRQRRWTREGLWDSILAALQGELTAAGRIDWEPRPGASRRCGRGENRPPGEPADHALGRSRGGFTTKLHLVTDGRGLPLAVTLSLPAAQRNRVHDRRAEGGPRGRHAVRGARHPLPRPCANQHDPSARPAT